MRCTTCNAENGGKAKFCSRCGSGLTHYAKASPIETIKRCGDCKVVVLGDACFCSRCGGSLAERIAPLPMAAVTEERNAQTKRYVHAGTAVAVMALAVAFVHAVGGSVLTSSVQTATAQEPTAKQYAAPTRPAHIWLAALRTDLQKCEGQSMFTRPICKEKAKFKHCRPNRWGTVEECPKVELPDETSL